MGYTKGKGKELQDVIIARTIARRQEILNFFKREGGATFGEMHQHINPKESAQKMNYHFYELKNNGYLTVVGLIKKEGPRSCKLWKAVRDVYKYEPSVIMGRPIAPDIDDKPYKPPVYINGICKVMMRHLPREPRKSPKVYIGSTMGML